MADGGVTTGCGTANVPQTSDHQRFLTRISVHFASGLPAPDCDLDLGSGYPAREHLINIAKRAPIPPCAGVRRHGAVDRERNLEQSGCKEIAPPPWPSASASPAYGPVATIKAYGLRTLRALDPGAHLGPDAGFGEPTVRASSL